MYKALLITVFLPLWGSQSFAQQEDDNIFLEDASPSLAQEGSFQSELSNVENFDYSEIENPEFQEDPSWIHDDQEIDFHEPLVEE